MKKNNETPQEYTTPTTLVIGWLSFIFGSIPIFIAINSGNKNALYLGLGMIIAGIILFAIGKFQSRKLLKKLSGKKAC